MTTPEKYTTALIALADAVIHADNGAKFTQEGGYYHTIGTHELKRETRPCRAYGCGDGAKPMNTTQLLDSLKLLNRIKEIDYRLAVCKSVTSVTIKGPLDGFVVEYDTAKMYAAKISAELISTRSNLVEQYLRISGQVESDQ